MNHKHVVYDEWLAGIFRRDVYRLVVDDGLIKSAGGLLDLLKDLQTKPVFIYTKVPTESLAAVRLLEKAGFNLVDTNIVFDKPVVAIQNFVGHCTVRFAVPEDRDQVVGLARRSFIYSRFHLDKAIPRETADTLKAEWVGNYFTGKRGDQMVVALVDGTIVGFLQLLYGRDKTVTIDLISVDASQRRKGIASDMIAYAEAECGDFKQIRVGTQIANVPSIRLYEKIGFRVTGAQYVFHYHHVPSPGHEGLGGAGQRR